MSSVQTSDYNQGKCQHVWETHCSCPWSSLISPVLRCAKSVFGRQAALALSQHLSWLTFWLKDLPKFFLITLSLFLSLSCKLHTHTHTLILLHISSLNVPCPCKWNFPWWPHVSPSQKWHNYILLACLGQCHCVALAVLTTASAVLSFMHLLNSTHQEYWWIVVELSIGVMLQHSVRSHLTPWVVCYCTLLVESTPLFQLHIWSAVYSQLGIDVAATSSHSWCCPLDETSPSAYAQNRRQLFIGRSAERKAAVYSFQWTVRIKCITNQPYY